MLFAGSSLKSHTGMLSAMKGLINYGSLQTDRLILPLETNSELNKSFSSDGKTLIPWKEIMSVRYR